MLNLEEKINRLPEHIIILLEGFIGDLIKRKPSVEKISEIMIKLPLLLKQLMEKKSHPIKDFTYGYARKENLKKAPGVYVFDDNGKDMYVGRSKDLSKRLANQHRSLQPNQAPITVKLSKGKEKQSMQKARKEFYRNFKVRWLKIDCEIERAMLEIYAAVILKTEMNDFEEH